MAFAATLLLAGCPSGGSSNADKDRLAFMQREPVLKLAIREPYAEVGFKISDKVPLHRSHIVAALADPVEPDVARKHGMQAVDSLRNSGWTVFYARCEEATFTAGAYKIAGDVSYHAQLTGAAKDGATAVVLQLRAPHSQEPTSDLFPNRPAGLATTCLETGGEGTGGTLAEISDLGPGPG